MVLLETFRILNFSSVGFFRIFDTSLCKMSRPATTASLEFDLTISAMQDLMVASFAALFYSTDSIYEMYCQ